MVISIIIFYSSVPQKSVPKPGKSFVMYGPVSTWFLKPVSQWFDSRRTAVATGGQSDDRIETGSLEFNELPSNSPWDTLKDRLLYWRHMCKRDYVFRVFILRV